MHIRSRRHFAIALPIPFDRSGCSSRFEFSSFSEYSRASNTQSNFPNDIQIQWLCCTALYFLVAEAKEVNLNSTKYVVVPAVHNKAFKFLIQMCFQGWISFLEETKLLYIAIFLLSWSSIPPISLLFSSLANPCSPLPQKAGRLHCTIHWRRRG